MSEIDWEFDPYRLEWIDDVGVGHYDPFLCKNTVHGCNGRCSHATFPPKVINPNRDISLTEYKDKVIQYLKLKEIK